MATWLIWKTGSRLDGRESATSAVPLTQVGRLSEVATRAANSLDRSARRPADLHLAGPAVDLIVRAKRDSRRNRTAQPQTSRRVPQTTAYKA